MKRSTLFFLALVVIVLGIAVFWIGLILNQMKGLK